MKTQSQTTASIEAVYDYVDEQGTLLYQVVRYDDKDFKYRRPDGQGDWIWNIGDTRKVPYRLPEVLAATTVYIVEGEKDVETLRAGGLVATTNPSGCGGKWQPEYNVHFKDKDVIIIADNDDPGKKRAGDIVKNLLPICKSVKGFDLSLWVSKAGDVTDFLATNTFADLKNVVDGTPHIQDVTDIDKFLRIESSDDESFIRMSSVVGDPNVEFLWFPYIPIGKVTILDGDPGVGKSFLTQALAAMISTGQNLNNILNNGDNDGPGLNVGAEAWIIVWMKWTATLDFITNYSGFLQVFVIECFVHSK